MSTEQLLLVVAVAFGALALGLVVGYILGRIGRSHTQSEFQGVLSVLRDALGQVQRIDSVVGTSKIGIIGERVVADLLDGLPLGWLITDHHVRGRPVEFAIRLSSGHIVPVDSKVVEAQKVAELGQTQEPAKRSKLEKDIRKGVLDKAREVADKYIDPGSPGYAIMAIPDDAYKACDGPTIYKAFHDHRILVVPYSLAKQFVLALHDLDQRAAVDLDTERTNRAVADAGRHLDAAMKTLNGPQRMADAINRLSTGSVALAQQLVDARQAIAQIRPAEQAQSSTEE